LPKDTYPSKDDVASYLQAYVSAFDLPVRLNAKVTSLTQRDGAYVVATGGEEFTATQVVVATGPFQVPFVPPIADELDGMVTQIHSADYRQPAQLPEGHVLVVGGGNSGFQIAEELAATRKVDLAVGQRVPSLPQRLLGKDLFWWLSGIGFMKVNTDSRLGRKLAKRDVLIGSSPRGIRRSGVTLRKRLTRAQGRRALFDDGSEQDIDAIVWATGYRSDFSWDRHPLDQGQERRHHPSARGYRRSRRVLHRAHLAAHAGVGADRVRRRGRRLHRGSHRLAAREPCWTCPDGS
jgi:putative flavoprotein involved in K+ transport